MTLNHGMLGTTKYNSQIGTASPPTPDPHVASFDIGATRLSHWVERTVRELQG